MNASLPGILFDLAKRVTEMVRSDHAAGKLTMSIDRYDVTKVQDFKYDRGVGPMTSSIETEVVETWPWGERFKYLDERVRTLGEYEQCQSLIERMYHSAEKKPAGALDRFALRILSDGFSELTDPVLVDRVSLFISDLNGGSTLWHARVWLEGVWLDDTELRIDGKKRLRRPTPLDLGFRELSGARYMSVRPMFFDPSAILEFEVHCRQRSTIEAAVNRTVDTLRLFRLGSVSVLLSEFSPTSILQAGLAGASTLKDTVVYKYGLSDSDAARFDELLNRIGNVLHRHDEVAVGPKISSAAVGLAFERYKDAILQSPRPEGRIATAVTALEALYLRGQERSELSHKLSQRVAMVVDNFGFKPIEVYRNMKDAYNIRSMFVHGATLEKDEQQRTGDVGDICRKTLEYARISILVYLQIDQEQGKDKLITRLDHALLDENARHKLKEQLHRLVVPIEGRVTEAQSEDSADSQPDD